MEYRLDTDALVADIKEKVKLKTLAEHLGVGPNAVTSKMRDFGRVSSLELFKICSFIGKHPNHYILTIED